MRTVVVILGMDRSGSSLCAAILQEFGLRYAAGGGLITAFLCVIALASMLMGRLSEFGIHPGSTDPSVLYRMLRMMEAEGLASSKLDPTGSGPARKVYYLTEEGMEVLGIWAAKLKETAKMFGKFAQRYAKLEKEQPAE